MRPDRTASNVGGFRKYRCRKRTVLRLRSEPPPVTRTDCPESGPAAVVGDRRGAREHAWARRLKRVVVAVDLTASLIHGRRRACTSQIDRPSRWSSSGTRAALFTEGEIDSADVADRDAPYYKGRSIAEVADAMTRAPCIDDIREGVEQLAPCGVDAVLCTVTELRGSVCGRSVWVLCCVRHRDARRR